MIALTKQMASLPGQGEKRSQHPGLGHQTRQTARRQNAVVSWCSRALYSCTASMGPARCRLASSARSHAQVKNVAGPAACLLHNPLHTLPHIVPLCIEHSRIEIALNADLPQTLPGLVQLDAEIDPDDVTPGLTHQFQKRTGARAKVDRRYARVRFASTACECGSTKVL